MTLLATTLERFNRKERHWLVRSALGSSAASLDSDFRLDVQQAISLKDHATVIGSDAWWATDYHLDWLVGALCVLAEGEDNAKKPRAKPNGLIEGNQRDVDLIIASGNTLILIEAKGVGTWSGEGFREKIKRLAAMTHVGLIKEDGRFGNFQLHFLLCSPGDAPKIDLSPWPNWLSANGKPKHVRLRPIPPKGSILATTSCDASGTPMKGDHWKVVEDKVANKIFHADDGTASHHDG